MSEGQASGERSPETQLGAEGGAEEAGPSEVQGEGTEGISEGQSQESGEPEEQGLENLAEETRLAEEVRGLSGEQGQGQSTGEESAETEEQRLERLAKEVRLTEETAGLPREQGQGQGAGEESAETEEQRLKRLAEETKQVGEVKSTVSHRATTEPSGGALLDAQIPLSQIQNGLVSVDHDKKQIQGQQSESEIDDAMSQHVSDFIRLVLAEERVEVQKETDVARSLRDENFTEDGVSRVSSAMAIQSICAKYKSMFNLQTRLRGDTAPEMTGSLERLVREYICSDTNLTLEGFTGQCPIKEGAATTDKNTRFASDVQILHYNPKVDHPLEPSEVPSVSPSTGGLVSTTETPGEISRVNVQPAASSWYQHPHIPNESFFRVPSNDPSGFRVMVPPNQMPEPSTLGLPIGPSTFNRMSYGVQESAASYMDATYHPLTSAHGLSEVHDGRTMVFPSKMPSMIPPPLSTAILDTDQEPNESVKSFKTGPYGVMSAKEVEETREFQTVPQVRVTVKENLRIIRETLDEVKKILRDDDTSPPPPST